VGGQRAPSSPFIDERGHQRKPPAGQFLDSWRKPVEKTNGAGDCTLTSFTVILLLADP
jgi:hypothetical protein